MSKKMRHTHLKKVLPILLALYLFPSTSPFLFKSAPPFLIEIHPSCTKASSLFENYTRLTEVQPYSEKASVLFRTGITSFQCVPRFCFNCVQLIIKAHSLFANKVFPFKENMSNALFFLR